MSSFAHAAEIIESMSPQECYDLVTALKQNIKIPVYVHTHATTGLGYMTYLKAAEAGADGIDCATSCMSGGTSQPATESMVYALQQMGFDWQSHSAQRSSMELRARTRARTRSK